MRQLDNLLILFVVAALLAVAILPLVGERYSQPWHEQIRVVAEPGRSHLTRIQVGLALQGSALHDWDEQRDSIFIRRYEEARAQERAAYAALDPLMFRMGSDVQRRYEEVRRLERDWHAVVDRFLARTGRQVPSRDPLQEDLYDDLLVATARLDEAIGLTAEESRRRILHAERWEQRITIVIAVLALVALVGVAWLGRRLRLVAREAQARRTELQRTIESRARLMRGVTHDLKNPLGAIGGHAQLLEDGLRGPLTDEQRDSVMRIRKAVQALLSLVDDILQLSQLEGRSLAIVRGELHPVRLLHAVAEEHRAAAEAAGHRLELEIAGDLPVIVTDAARIRQVLGNLLSNAIKFTPPGGLIVLRAALRPADARQECPELVITVSDTGPGIPADKAEVIFEEFSRLEIHAGTPGTGLGLAIARHVARLLGGDLELGSRPEKGATLMLRLPAERLGERATRAPGS